MYVGPTEQNNITERSQTFLIFNKHPINRIKQDLAKQQTESSLHR